MTSSGTPSRHLNGVRVSQLVRREASPHAGLAGDASQLRARGVLNHAA